MRWVPALSGQSAQDVVVAADEDEIYGVPVFRASLNYANLPDTLKRLQCIRSE
jgi:hypothetical protein